MRLEAIAGGKSAKALPPHHLDTEAAILAALILGETAPVDLAPLRAECFYSDAHRHVFEAVCAIITSGGVPSVETVAGRLREVERLVDVGGTVAIGKILDNAPTLASLPEAVRLVVDAWARREIARKGDRWVSAARRQGSDTGEFVALIRRELDEIEERRVSSDKPTDLLSGFKADFERRQAMAESASRVVATGYPTVDRAMDGGLWEGTMVMVGARPGCGKTAVGLNLCVRCAETEPENGGGAALFVSVELPVEDIRQRLVCHESGMSKADYKNGRSEAEVTRWVSYLSNLPIFVDGESRTIEAIHASIRRHKRQLEAQGKRLRLVVVDYFQEVGTLAQHERKVDLLTEVSKGFIAIRKELPGATLVILAQINRDGGKGARRPALTDIGDCDYLARPLDTAMMLWQPDPEKEPDKIEMTFAKNRGLHMGFRPVFHRESLAGSLTEVQP